MLMKACVKTIFADPGLVGDKDDLPLVPNSFSY
jgi:hypothetical protein